MVIHPISLGNLSSESDIEKGADRRRSSRILECNEDVDILVETFTSFENLSPEVKI